MAEKFLIEGWAVGLIARREDALTDVAKGHANAHVLPCDVTDPVAFAAFSAAMGRVDVLFNNAGIFTAAAPIDEVLVQDWLDAVNVNLTGMFLCARAAFGKTRHQSPQGGRIINNGSVLAHVPRDGSVTYTTTKHGVTGLTKSLALDGRAFNIACGQIDIGNAQCPIIDALAANNRSQPCNRCRMVHGVPAAAHKHPVSNDYGDANALCCARLDQRWNIRNAADANQPAEIAIASDIRP